MRAMFHISHDIENSKSLIQNHLNIEYCPIFSIKNILNRTCSAESHVKLLMPCYCVHYFHLILSIYSMGSLSGTIPSGYHAISKIKAAFPNHTPGTPEPAWHKAVPEWFAEYQRVLPGISSGAQQNKLIPNSGGLQEKSSAFRVESLFLGQMACFASTASAFGRYLF